MSKENKQCRKERHERVAKEDINILDYEPLLHKVLNNLYRRYGKYVYYYKEDLIQEGWIALIKALESYDPKRGTYVTLAYLRVYTFMQRALNKLSKDYVISNALSDLKFPNPGKEELTWEDLFYTNEIDLSVIERLSLKTDQERKVVSLLKDGMSETKIAKDLSMSKGEVAAIVSTMKEEMIAVCNELYNIGV